jgi:multidrug transporter EmrE-like cation transporter
MLIPAGMAVCSVFGQMGMLLALSQRLPGLVVFPVAIGGGLLLVVVVGVRGFHERLSTAGYLGIGVGTLALVLLALP